MEQLLHKAELSKDNIQISTSKEDLAGHLNIVVNKFFSTVDEYPQTMETKSKMLEDEVRGKRSKTNLIEGLNGSKDWVFLPNFYNVIKRH